MCNVIVGSYLDYPRINFVGEFRADTNTINNDLCNYNMPSTVCKDFDSLGTNEFYFHKASIISVVYENGTLSDQDPIVNARLINNLNRPPPKMVDPYSSVYGMSVHIVEESATENPHVFVEGTYGTTGASYNEFYGRGIGGLQGDSADSALGLSKIKDVSWYVSNSLALQQLKDASSGGALSIKSMLYDYSLAKSEGNFTFGLVVGSIGISKLYEAVNFGGQRLLSFQSIADTNITVDNNDNCEINKRDPSRSKAWVYKAPFQINAEDTLSVDLSNALPYDSEFNLCNLGALSFGFIRSGSSCVELVGDELDYLSLGWMNRTSGIVDISLSGSHYDDLLSNDLLLVQVSEVKYSESFLDVCEVFTGHSHYAQKVLQEIQYYVRPMEYSVYRLQKDFNENETVQLLVTDRGRPAQNIMLNVTTSAPGRPIPIPANGIVIVDGDSIETDGNGIAEFTFHLQDPIDYPRPYLKPLCSTNSLCTGINKDTQEYNIDFKVFNVEETFEFEPVYVIAFSDPSNFNYREPYTWVDHVQPIFQQYYYLYPVMMTILNLSDYSSVVLPQNINLLNYSMSLDFYDPSYMPVTRDLSPLKQKVILKWLEDPVYSLNNTNCKSVSQPQLELDPVCENNQFGSAETHSNYEYYKSLTEISPDKLQQWHFDAMYKNCTLGTLQQQLQQAIELEFATIPLYLTGLYSIADGCNTEAYQLIRSVVMQEMLHMSQSANILIAVGGRPLVDSNHTAPSYPTLGLPGGVLPKLNVTLKKASLEHIRKVYLGVEYPHETHVAREDTVITNSTIGQFYQQVNNCMSELTAKGMNIFTGNPSHQLKWPWKNNTYGTLHAVHNLSDAQQGIEEIIIQGEGASPINPDYSRDTLAHFYKFEEIVCKRELINVSATQYAYKGKPIPFLQQGVWSMRDNPRKHGILPDTVAHFEAKAFHKAYRNLLRAVQAAFDGNPDKLQETVRVMESLQVHGKRVMSTPIDGSSGETVGPVFDYVWE